MFIIKTGKTQPDKNVRRHLVCAYTYTYTTERYRTLNVRCHSTAVIMWHCGADICVSSVHSNEQPKTVHNQVAVPLTTYQPSKQRNLSGNTHTALQCVCATKAAVRVTILHYSVCASKAVCSSCHHTALVCVPAMLSAVRVTLCDWQLIIYCRRLMKAFGFRC